MKLDFQRAVLNRIPEIEAHPEQHFRQVLFPLRRIPTLRHGRGERADRG